MKTRPEIEIHNDLDLCECQEEKVCCQFLTVRDKKTFCPVYREYLEGKEIEKCAQCKSDFLKAKLEEPTDCIVLDGYRFDCVKMRLHTHCHTQAILLLNEIDRQEFIKRFKQIDESSVSTHNGMINKIGFVFAHAQYSYSDIITAVEVIIKEHK